MFDVFAGSGSLFGSDWRAGLQHEISHALHLVSPAPDNALTDRGEARIASLPFSRVLVTPQTTRASHGLDIFGNEI